MIPLLLTLAGAADLPRFEVAAEIATVPRHNDYARAGGGQRLGLGGRVGYDLHPRLAVVGTGHHTRYGAQWSVEDQDFGVVATDVTDFGLGVRANVPVASVFRLTGEAIGLLTVGRIRAQSPDEVVRVSRSGLGSGFRVSGGAEVALSSDEAPIPLTLSTTLGWQYGTQVDYDLFGDAASRGAFGRIGIGIRL